MQFYIGFHFVLSTKMAKIDNFTFVTNISSFQKSSNYSYQLGAAVYP